MLGFKKITFSFPICTSHSLRSWSVIVFPAQILLGHIYLSWSKSVRIYRYIFMLIISWETNFFFFNFAPPPHITFQMVHPLSFVEDFIIAMKSLFLTLFHFNYLRRLAWWHTYCKTRNFLIKVEWRDSKESGISDKNFKLVILNPTI